MTQQADYPLAGIRVLDMSRVLAGPFAGRMLSDLGADVVKVEPPDGDITRLWGHKINGISGYFNQQNLGKRDICVDLTAPAGADVVRALVPCADVLIENFRPGIMARYGLDYPQLQALNPRLVMLSISGFGQQGPESQRAAYASIVHAESGFIARQAEITQGPPADLVLSVADFNAGLHGLVALLSALLMRQRTGKGQHIDMAMMDAMLINDDQIHYWTDDAVSVRTLPSDIWQTPAGPLILSGDFRFIWKQLSTVCGVEDPTPADASLEEKIRYRREAAQAFFNNLGSREAVIAALAKMNIAWGDVRDGFQTLQQPTLLHRGSIMQVDDRNGGTRPVARTPYRFSDAASGSRRGAPHQGEHNLVVLREWAGVDEAQLQAWQAAGALVPMPNI